MPSALAAREKGLVEVRLIHGRGKGVQRARPGMPVTPQSGE